MAENNHPTALLEPDADEAELAEQYLSFRCNGEAYALPIAHVREIIEFDNITSVPMMPSFIRGVINLRGNVVPVVDLGARFGQSSITRTKRTCIVVLELEKADGVIPLGLVVDSVDAVLDIEAGDIEPAPNFGTGVRADFILGMARREQGFIIILQVDQVLSLEDMKRLTEIGDKGVALLEGPETSDEPEAGYQSFPD